MRTTGSAPPGLYCYNFSVHSNIMDEFKSEDRRLLADEIKKVLTPSLELKIKQLEEEIKTKYEGKFKLTSVAENVKQSERYSDWYDSDNNCNTQSNKDYSMIDHVLVTSGIKNKISDVYFYHGYSEYCGTYNSDHYPVVIDLNI